VAIISVAFTFTHKLNPFSVVFTRLIDEYAVFVGLSPMQGSCAFRTRTWQSSVFQRWLESWRCRLTSPFVTTSLSSCVICASGQSTSVTYWTVVGQTAGLYICDTLTSMVII